MAKTKGLIECIALFNGSAIGRARAMLHVERRRENQYPNTHGGMDVPDDDGFGIGSTRGSCAVYGRQGHSSTSS
jgi:hypothetical protein